MTIKMNNNREWLEKMIELEDYGAVSAGGLFARMLSEGSEQVAEEEPKVLGRLVEFARRRKGWTVSELAEKADIELSEALAIESDKVSDPQPRTLFELAKALDLPEGGIMELAGLLKKRDDQLATAAVRFAAKAEPTTKLSQEEKDALDEFVRVLAERSDRS